jgi:hypothetical protein
VLLNRGDVFGGGGAEVLIEVNISPLIRAIRRIYYREDGYVLLAEALTAEGIQVISV